MNRADPHIAFLDEAGVPEIPALSKGSVGAVFCIANVFMPMHYWCDLQQINDEVRNDFGIPTNGELSGEISCEP